MLCVAVAAAAAVPSSSSIFRRRCESCERAREEREGRKIAASCMWRRRRSFHVQLELASSLFFFLRLPLFSRPGRSDEGKKAAAGQSGQPASERKHRESDNFSYDAAGFPTPGCRLSFACLLSPRSLARSSLTAFGDVRSSVKRRGGRERGREARLCAFYKGKGPPWEKLGHLTSPQCWLEERWRYMAAVRKEGRRKKSCRSASLARSLQLDPSSSVLSLPSTHSAGQRDSDTDRCTRSLDPRPLDS